MRVMTDNRKKSTAFLSTQLNSYGTAVYHYHLSNGRVLDNQRVLVDIIDDVGW